MRISTRVRPIALLTAAALAAGAWLGPIARAEDDGGATPGEPPLKELFEKALKSMRSSERSLLEASRAGGKQPAAPDTVPPPEGDRAKAGAPPPTGPDAPPAPTTDGDAAKRALEDLLHGARTTSARVPRELEEILAKAPH